MLKTKYYVFYFICHGEKEKVSKCVRDKCIKKGW